MLSFIVNPNSGSGRGADIWKKTKEYLTERDIPHELHLTTYAGEAKEIADRLTSIATEERIIIIIGGDGTQKGALSISTEANSIKSSSVITTLCSGSYMLSYALSANHTILSKGESPYLSL